MNNKEIQKKYSELFEICYEFSTLSGWDFIIQTLCEKIVNYEKRLRDNLKTANKYKDEKQFWKDEIPVLEAKIKQLEENPFRWLQIKDKFSTGRYYYQGGTLEMSNWVDFAESLTYQICEKHGAPVIGFLTKGWYVRVCEICAEEFKKEGREVAYFNVTEEEEDV